MKAKGNVFPCRELINQGSGYIAPDKYIIGNYLMGTGDKSKDANNKTIFLDDIHFIRFPK